MLLQQHNGLREAFVWKRTVNLLQNKKKTHGRKFIRSHKGTQNIITGFFLSTALKKTLKKEKPLIRWELFK